MDIHCVECAGKVNASLVYGTDVYPHRPDLATLPFWRCDICRNHVGCHWKTKNPTRPLGCIPNAALKNARQHIHALLDPLWKSGKYGRGEVYKIVGDKIGRKYHTAQIRSVEEARNIYRIVKEIAK